MRSSSWQRLKSILEAALEVPADEQTTVLERHCHGDLNLQSQAEVLLRSRARLRDGFLERPLWSVHVPRERESEGDLGQPKRVGPYRLFEQVGHGGMGKVYRAVREADFEQEVAIKFVDPSKVGRFASEDHHARFELERQMLAYLDHPYIAHLLDGGTAEDDTPYFVMEYVEGAPIDVYCDTHRLSIRRRLELFLKVCSAVEAAHRSLIVHRDLKPGNILVTSDGEPKLLDFGIAKHLEPDAATLTAAGASPMTPRYASPEQVSGAPVTTSIDVYALGVLLYHLLCGRPPYEVDSQNLYQLSKVICETKPTLPSRAVAQAAPVGEEGSSLTPEVIARLRETSVHRLQRRLSGDLDAILLKALRKSPRNRYGSVELMADDIRNHVRGLPVRARHSTLVYLVGKFVRRQKLVAALAVALIICILILLGMTSKLGDQAEREENLLSWLSSDALLYPRESALTEAELLELSAYLPDLRHPVERARRARVAGLSLQTLGFDKLAEGMYEIVLETERTRQGDVDREWMGYLKESGDVFYAARNYYMAARYFKELEVIWRHQDPDHPNRVSNLVDWGSALRMGRYYEEASARYRQALELAEERSLVSSTEIVRIRYSLASVAFTRGELREAEQELARAQDVAAKVANLDPGVRVNIAGLLGRVQTHLGRPEAEATLRRNLELRRQLSSENVDHLDIRRKVALAERDLAAFLLLRGRLLEGRKSLNNALEVLQSGPEGASDVVTEADALRGYLAAAAGDDVSAAILFQQGYRAVCRTKGEGTFQVEQSALRVAEVYARLGQAQASDWRQRAESRSCEALWE